MVMTDGLGGKHGLFGKKKWHEYCGSHEPLWVQEWQDQQETLGHSDTFGFVSSCPHHYVPVENSPALTPCHLCALTCRSSLESTDPLSLPPGLAAFRVKFLVMK